MGYYYGYPPFPPPYRGYCPPYGGGGFAFALIVVLVILLIILGCGWFK
ncbi:sporulation protein YjcZ [Halalkalibacterium halodurans]|uniref:BH2691 protein n=1 Tax=Halalkalibacterium halodurans (strain ATCC BAA-125 / DSM 18197 / FERM 7344 / JCM 9153 / C-125) TaxID=272558 RepID=Q9K9F6_HALH5|nr:sporulation protein YjcZ [Halalkalibacterium halodurans]MDY7223225.1 sporulation protein YjcZ [Halalkalibacterium halodurans]MDY7242446.1 sporulation protein YjcZ [Halalkalibacterium halodurans]MED3646267.1 sporulation protein YjcZ [Halalkalibacterium halodurans]MED4081479.1 sporulation protein YjcZ [Halalkalibacterium halodurans]MED4086945.1 sporulation protein YjcZ [Halalkalibacterium halodurans]